MYIIGKLLQPNFPPLKMHIKLAEFSIRKFTNVCRISIFVSGKISQFSENNQICGHTYAYKPQYRTNLIDIQCYSVIRTHNHRILLKSIFHTSHAQ